MKTSKSKASRQAAVVASMIRGCDKWVETRGKSMLDKGLRKDKLWGRVGISTLRILRNYLYSFKLQLWDYTWNENRRGHSRCSGNRARKVHSAKLLRCKTAAPQDPSFLSIPFMLWIWCGYRNLYGLSFCSWDRRSYSCFSFLFLSSAPLLQKESLLLHQNSELCLN